MTSYRYNVTLTDSETITIEDAFDLLEKHIKTLNGETPAFAHIQNIASIRMKIEEGASLRSSNNFWNPLPQFPRFKDPKDMTDAEIANLRDSVGGVSLEMRRSRKERLQTPPVPDPKAD
jgi:hypothetical protein